ncbi:hypothetical protein HYPP_02019 [Hyphomicrobium sp. ghe19]|nr:hypothetical protein HYPP_02019 [Hyphomicrobium sp. ghe19]
MKANKPILNYQGTKIYESFKNGASLRYWYALVPNCDAERPVSPDARLALPVGYAPKPIFEAKRSLAPSDIFDVRRLPARYTAGLTVENGELHRPLRFDLMRAEREAHLEAMRRAIDDGYDFRMVEVPKKIGRIRHWLGAIARKTLIQRVR